MKSIIHITALLLSFSSSYVIFAYIEMNTNILEWGKITRIFLVIGTVAFFLLSKDSDDEE